MSSKTDVHVVCVMRNLELIMLCGLSDEILFVDDILICKLLFCWSFCLYITRHYSSHFA